MGGVARTTFSTIESVIFSISLRLYVILFQFIGEGRIVGQVQAVDQTGQVKLTGNFVVAMPKRG